MPLICREMGDKKLPVDGSTAKTLFICVTFKKIVSLVHLKHHDMKTKSIFRYQINMNENLKYDLNEKLYNSCT